MHLYINLLGRNIPSYGLCIVIGGVVTNIIAYYILKKKDFDIDDFILMETYGFLGAFIGAKVLYLLVSINEIDWNRFFQYKYFLTLMEGGFVFYGGIIGAIIFAYISSRIYSIYFWNYFKEVLFLLPLGHAFGRIGCFMA
ncbi:MAG: prolipoprotein diacylglyceryl transferase, partial [Pseudobutyrivibrio sp.]|nr:prolipoprotein diacylglyceryl transferase [Pseudobutyrivibrio sp.]